MATAELPTSEQSPPADSRRPARDPVTTKSNPFEILSSLRLTVALFAASVLLILFGTLAQVHYDVWHVVRETHFRVWWAWIEWRSIGRLMQMLFGGQWDNPSTAGFWFPGGQLIGSLMLLNLLAAHTVRFKISAKGSRLAAGLAVLAVGGAAVAGVVVLGSGDTIKSELSPTGASVLWHSLRASVAGLALAGVYWLVGAKSRIRPPEWRLAASLVALVVLAAGWLFMNPDFRLDDAGLRILWHLVKGTAAAAILFAGCWLVFGKRAGIVVIHAGVGLLMLGEMLTGLTAEEARMRINEGQTVNYAYDIRTTELALTDRSDPGEELVSVVPQRLIAGAKPDEVISHPELPVDLKVLRFDINSDLAPPEDQENLATAGAGLRVIAKPRPQESGIDSEINLPAAYVQLIDKASGEPVGVYLVSLSGNRATGFLDEQPVEVGGKTYGLELRFKRLYKPYSVTLHDFQANYYPGTQVAKDFRAIVHLKDPEQSVDRDVTIWMNNPLRYAGDTLYQSGFTSETTTELQVVSNAGWLIPYLSCQIVLVGLLAHFGLTLSGFLRRRTEEARRKQKAEGVGLGGIDWKSPLVIGPIVVGVVWAGYLASKGRPHSDAPGEMRLEEFAALPLADGGRIKPYDTLARNTLQLLSSRQTVALGKAPLPADASIFQQFRHSFAKEERLPAINWMLDLVTRKDASEDYRVFRIENLEVLDLLGLDRRPGSYRYSYSEVIAGDNNETIGKQYDLIRDVDDENCSVFQQKIAELVSKLSAYRGLAHAFAPLPITGDSERIMNDLLKSTDGALLAARGQSPQAVAPKEPGGPWLTQYEAQLNALFQRFPAVRQSIAQAFANAPMVRGELTAMFKRFDEAGDSAMSRSLGEALDAYRAGDTFAFNTQVRALSKQFAAYEVELNDPDNARQVASLAASERVSLTKAKFEAYFNEFSPFFLCWVSYIVGFGLCAASWLVWPRALGRAATAILVATFLLHTFAIVARVYISGRPPVTNLYSSAVAVGWGVVLAGLVFEAIFRMGFGSLLASVFGVATLVTAHFMALDGDTFTVLQAVLDTQFWLATHVVCVTFGYAATFVAGGLGMIYLIRGHLLGNLGESGERALPRMIYGTLCFAIFFSFVGTVLGGLWGDNSWGRFWGWDPKENGALIIVLWNALVLHARWGKMVGATGLAALAVFGNVCTTWSWFGTNEMGVGLHAYGGLSDGVSLELGILRAVAFSHPLIIAIAFLPRNLIASGTKGPAAGAV